MNSGKVHVTKLAAADRQLRAATRMFFAREDELAIHTVASAAYRVISDIKTDRGIDEAETSYLVRIFYAVRDYRRGTLPDIFTQNAEIMEWIRSWAAQLPVQADSNIDEFSLRLSPELIRKYWTDRNRIGNFLKHADRDIGATIAVEDLDNFHLLAQCWGAYTDISKDCLNSNEGLVFRLYLHSSFPYTGDVPPPGAEIVRELSDVSEAERITRCDELLRKLTEESA